MLCYSSIFGLPSDSLNDTFVLYKGVIKQYRNPDIHNIVLILPLG